MSFSEGLGMVSPNCGRKDAASVQSQDSTMALLRYRDASSHASVSLNNSNPPTAFGSDDARSSVPPELNQLEAGEGDTVIMAVSLKENGALGCAYYSASHRTLYLLNDLEAQNISVLRSLLLHTQPTSVILPLSSPGVALEFFGQKKEDDSPQGERGSILDVQYRL